MGTTIKGIYEGIKYIFVKEREMEIGSPTDVKHVSHIGSDDSSAGGPSWMNQFKIEQSSSSSSPVSSITQSEQWPTRMLTVEISSTETTTTTHVTPKKREKKIKADSSSVTSSLNTEISSTDTSVIPKRREKKNKATSSSSTLKLSNEIPSQETPTIQKKRKKKNMATSSPSTSLRSSKHAKTKANLVEAAQ